MRLYVDTMDSTLVDFSPDGRVRFEDEDWIHPTIQERRAIIYSARRETAQLGDLIAALEVMPEDAR